MRPLFSERGRSWAGLLLGAATCAVFWPAVRNGFVNYDDPLYVTLNPYVRGGFQPSSLLWAFTSIHEWHPLTWLSHMLDCRLFGLNPWGHHLTSVLLHSANVALLFLMLAAATESWWAGALAAAWFGAHPLRVESVAWVSERKDVLCGFFLLLGVLAYLRGARRPSAAGRAAVAIFFALALMSKPMAVTFPFLLLLLDYWPLRRLDDPRPPALPTALVREKLPLFALSAASCALTVWTHGINTVSATSVPWPARWANVWMSHLRYIAKTLVPGDLVVYYPYPNKPRPAWEAAAAAALIAALCALAWKTRKSKPHLLVGWLWYLGALVPVIGLFQIADQAMADRYTYIPHMGLALLLAGALSRLGDRLTQARRRALALACAAALIPYGLRTRSQLSIWRSSEALWSHVLNVYPDVFIAHANLANDAALAGRLDEAAARYRKALAIKPDSAQVRTALAHVYNELGVLRAMGGGLDEAAVYFRQAVQARPDDAGFRRNLDRALAGRGDRRRAAD